MSERQPIQEHEKQLPSPESIRDAVEQTERLAKSHEQAAERSKELPSAEALELSARQEALESANNAELAKDQHEKPKKAPERRGAPTKKERDASFNTTMTRVRKNMGGGSRAFSKVIHAKPVEKASEVVGSTIARPNAILAGGASALLFTVAIYVVARYYGYQLSGFESIGTFIFGWIAGTLFDYVRVGFSNRKE